jgi:4-amino-4-deoxy-L-arabinose transferase-like glycosyltransferase
LPQSSLRRNAIGEAVATPGAVEAMSASSARAFAIAIILAFAVARCGFDLSLGFGVDEAYTLTVARRLAWSYFDHPPLHQWIAHFAALALGEGPFARLPFVALFAFTGWLIFALTRDLFGAGAGLWAIFALNVTPFFFASAGAWIVPDGPLLLALAAAAFLLSRLFFAPRANAWILWLAAGLCLGLAGLSKYNAIFVALGLVLFLALSPRQRHWFLHPAPYCAGLIALAMVAPVFYWNAENHWVSFRFQGGRAALAGHWRATQVATMALAEIALLSPWIAAPLIGGLFAAAQRAARGEDDGRRLFLLSLALPSIIVFTLTPLWGARGLPHWPMPGWLFAYPLLGAWLAEKRMNPRALRAWAIGSAALLAFLTVIVVAQADSAWLTRAMPSLAGGLDPTLETLSWSALRDAPALRGPSERTFIVATKWSEAGKIAQSLGPGRPTLVFSDDPRGFAFLDDPARFVGEDAVIIVAQKRLQQTIAALTPYFANLDPPQSLSLGRAGLDEIDLSLIPAHRLIRAYPLPYPLRAAAP